jgi:hypothetical protein
VSIPKLFISYSWSDATHEQWVVDLAENLRESGVDVILDKWDLKEGHDAVAFMEKMVTDPEIKKVVIISDKTYAEKADGRSGGVGTETQIISKEVYDNQEQDKFVAVVSQKNDEGTPYLPTYYKSRIYIDLSEPDNHGENFDKLLRWVYNKPLHVKPELGSRPAFLDEKEGISLGTSIAHKRAVAALKENRPNASGALEEYLSLFSENLDRFRIQSSDFDGEFDDAIVESIEQFLPYRNEIIQLFFTISHYAPSDENILKLHRFFESLIPYMNRPNHIRQYSDVDFDNFKFIVHELFLYVIAILLKSEQFEQANIFLTQQYYMAGNAEYGKDVMVRFDIFGEHVKSLEIRNNRLKLNRSSVRADLIEQRSKGSGLEFRHLMQADFTIFMRAEIDTSSPSVGWWPETLVYIGYTQSAFEIYARSESRQYFNRVKCILGIDSPLEINDLLERYESGHSRLPRWQSLSLNPKMLMGYDKLSRQI